MVKQRIRTVKPEFFTHDVLFDAEQETGLPLRLAFIGLWTCCDREGRFEWKPRPLKTYIMPYDDVDFPRVLDALATRGFVVGYACGGKKYGKIPTWKRHQVVNNRESPSDIPDIPEVIDIDDESTRQPRVMDASATRYDLDQGEVELNRTGIEVEGNGSPQDDHPEHDLGEKKEAAAAAVLDLTEREKILKAMGVGPDGTTGPSSFIGGIGDMAELEKWKVSGLSIDEKIAVISEVCERQRRKSPQWMPRGFAYFTQPIADLAARKKLPMPSGDPSVKFGPKLTASEERSNRLKRIAASYGG